MNGNTEGCPIEEASRVVNGARQHAYGHPLDNHGNTAELWRAWLKRKFEVDIPLRAEDVCWLMVLLKASREANRSKHDNLVDGIGYLKNVHMIKEERTLRGEA